jgi:hypothetical protein
MLNKLNTRKYILKETVTKEEAPVNSVAGGGVDMAPNAKGTKVFKALKKKFKDRKDKDIDNDGDEDDSDEYLHKKRKAISAKMKESRKTFKQFRSEAHEIGTDEYSNYTKEMTPGEAITNKDARKADANKKKEQAAQQNQLNVDEEDAREAFANPPAGMKFPTTGVKNMGGPNRRKQNLGGNKRRGDVKKIPVAKTAEEKELDELSNKTMDSYAQKATASQASAEKKGDYKKADKRMAGKMRASRRKFSNDTNKILRGLNK